MPNTTAKSHKSRKTDCEPTKPRQRTFTATGIPTVVIGSSPVEGSSSLVPATTASVTPTSLEDATEQQTAKIDTGIPAEKPREQQPWYRAPDSKLRKQAEKIAVLRVAGHNGAIIAKRLKTTEGNVRYVEYVARKNGWYDEADEPVDLEAELANSIDRKVVRNISSSLDGQMTNWQTHEMTLAAAKGRGVFKSHDKVEGGQTQLPIVAIQIVMPALGATDQEVLDEDHIGGTPAYLEGAVADESLDDGLTIQSTNPEPGADSAVGADPHGQEVSA